MSRSPRRSADGPGGLRQLRPNGARRPAGPRRTPRGGPPDVVYDPGGVGLPTRHGGTTPAEERWLDLLADLIAEALLRTGTM